MKRMPPRRLFSAVMAAAFFAGAVAAGCSRRVGIAELEKAEFAEAAMQEALAAQAAGDFAHAEEIFRDISVAQPLNGVARLQLGIILHDFRNDPFAAMSEYNAYLRLRPDADKVQMVEERIKLCRDAIGKTYASLATDIDYIAINKELEQKIAQLEKEIASREERLKFAEDEKAAMRVEMAKMSDELDRRQKLLDNVMSQDEGARPTSSVISDFERKTAHPSTTGETSHTSASTGEAWEHKVVRGDSLWSLAQKFYGDASRSKEIRDANKGKLGPNDTLIEGTVIRIPK